MFPSPQDLFARTDDGAGGPLQTWKRRLKFKLRYVWFRQSLEATYDALSQLGLSAILQSDPKLLLRSTRTYLWSGLSVTQRVDALRAHFEWAVRVLGVTWITSLFKADRLLVAQWPLKDEQVSLWIQPGYGYGREGELVLELNLNDVPVMRSAFSVLPHHLVGVSTPGDVLVIGNLQGSQEGKDLMKELTQLMERTRPPGIFFNIWQGLAQAWGLVAIVGVSDAGHAYASYGSLAKRVGMNYDSLWQELGAEQKISKAHWLLPDRWEPKPESEVASNKRSQLKRRNALRADIQTTVNAWANAMKNA